MLLVEHLCNDPVTLPRQSSEEPPAKRQRSGPSPDEQTANLDPLPVEVEILKEKKGHVSGYVRWNNGDITEHSLEELRRKFSSLVSIDLFTRGRRKTNFL